MIRFLPNDRASAESCNHMVGNRRKLYVQPAEEESGHDCQG